jgi:hypothetical protein
VISGVKRALEQHDQRDEQLLISHGEESASGISTRGNPIVVTSAKAE